MNLQTYLALKAVVEADFEKLIFYQAISDIDPPNYAVKSVGPAALISLADAAAVPAESIKIDFEPIQEDDPEPPHSYNGSFVSFSSKKQVNAEDVLVNIEPVQDLHGYDSPWPAGGGVNKIDVNQLVSYGTTYGLTVSFDGDWIVLSGEYTHTNQAANFRIATQRDNSVFPVTKYKAFPDSNTSSHISSNAFGLADGNKTLTIRISGMVQGETYNLRCKIVGYEGDTAPTDWTPYSNICPISGRTGAKVTVNEDVLDITFPSEAGTVYGGTLDVTNGVLTVDRAMVDLGTLNWNYNSNWNGAGAFYSIVEPSGIIRPTGNAVPNVICTNYGTVSRQSLYNDKTDKKLCIPPDGKVSIRDYSYTDSVTFKTAISGAQLVYELVTPVTYTLTPQEVALLRGGNTLWADTGDVKVDTPLIPAPISGRTGIKLYHSGSTQNMPDLVEVDWEDELGTVYGGTLDIVSGVLTVDRALVDLGTLSWVSLSWGYRSNSLSDVAKKPNNNSGVANIVSSRYKTQSYNATATYGIALSSDGLLGITDTSASPTGNLCYELATPITHHLSPTQVTMLLGANTLWSDDGKITLVYKAKK